MVKITPKQKKVRNAELGFKNRQVKFSDEVENNQSTLEEEKKSLDGMPTEFFVSNGRQEIDDSNLDEKFDDPKTPTVVTLDRCDIKPVSFFNIFQKTKALKKPLMVFFYTREQVTVVSTKNILV